MHLNYLGTHQTNWQNYNQLVQKRYSYESHTNYFSNHIDRQKINIVHDLIDGAIKISDPQFHDLNIIIVKKILKDNDHDENCIDKHIKTRLRQMQTSSTNPPNSNLNSYGAKQIAIPVSFSDTHTHFWQNIEISVKIQCQDCTIDH